MATQRASDETEIRQRVDRLVEAVRATDLDGLRLLFAPDIVSFDVQPPLQVVGAEAKARNWADAFAMFQRPVGYEVRDLEVTLGGDVAFAHGFGRLSGTLRNGTTTAGFWVRYTVCFRKIDGEWLIVHDHVSVPMDVESGKASLTFEF